MKIQIDTKEKTVKVEETVKFSELIDAMEKLLPNEWKSFSLETNTIINNWDMPIIIEKHPYPWEYPWITYSKTYKRELKEGTFCVEL